MSLKVLAEHVRAQGRGPDTELVHLTKREVSSLRRLARAAGGDVTTNPKTGLPEAGFLDSMLPTILGVAANFVVPGSGVVVGGLTGALQNKENPLMGAALGAMGGYGGGQIANGLGQMGATTATPEMLAAANQAADPIGALAQAQQSAAAAGAQAPTGLAAAQGGLSQAMANPNAFVNTMGGGMEAAKAAGMAAAPAFGSEFGLGANNEIKKPGEGEGRRYSYEAGYTGGTQTGSDPSSERRWFDPRYTPYAEGGEVRLRDGDFVIPADVVSMAGGGSTEAGLRALARQTGARPIRGEGDGLSDSISASINGTAPARVADGEAYVPRAQVMAKGGPAQFHKALANIRKQAHGKTKQQRPVDVRKAFK